MQNDSQVALIEVPSQFARSVQPSEYVDPQDMLAQVKALTALREQALSVEAQLREELGAQISALQKQIAEAQEESKYKDLDSRFPRLDISFLKQNKKSGGVRLPAFAVFGLTSEFCTFEARGSRRWGIRTSGGPLGLSNSYFDLSGLNELARKTTRRWARGDVTVTITARFAGAIPESVRQQIRDASPLFETVVLITEAPQWSISQSVETAVKRDPLVVGIKGGKRFWLITSFDTTPVEAYIEQEFTERRSQS